MKLLNSKMLVTPVKSDNKYGYEDKEEVKLGKLSFSFKGKADDEEVEFKKGDEIYYQYSSKIKLDGTEYDLVSLNNVICQK